MIHPRTATATVAVSIALATLAGCGELAERELDFTRTEAVRITEIVVEPGSGDVVVRTAPRTDVQIKRTVRYHADEPGATYRIEGTTLTIDTNCGRECSVSYDITAPEGVAVRGKNGSGDLALTGVSAVDVTVGSGDVTVNRAAGAVNVQTGSGDITATDVPGTLTLRTGSGSITTRAAGAVNLHTDSGDITATDVRGPAKLGTGSGMVEGRGIRGGDVEATAGSGDIRLSLDTPQSVRVHTRSGAVELSVPDGRYRVPASTGTGDKDIQVSDDPAAQFVLDLRADSGDISVRRL